MIRINGKPAQTPVLDRGLLYGDGLFETLRLIDGTAPLWSQHWQRLSRGMRFLSMPFAPQLASFLVAELAALPSAQMARITITRANQGRGYRAGQAPIKVVVQGFEQLPPSDPKCLQWIDHRLSHQPALVPYKHLSRLDQVIGANGLQAPFTDGVMCDQEGAVTCATVGNLFIWDGDTLLTPKLDRAGVQGVMRALVISACAKLNISCREARIYPQDLYTAQRIWVSNAVRGLQPVCQLAGQTYATDSILPQLFRYVEDIRHGRQIT